MHLPPLTKRPVYEKCNVERHAVYGSIFTEYALGFLNQYLDTPIASPASPKITTNSAR